MLLTCFSTAFHSLSPLSPERDRRFITCALIIIAIKVTLMIYYIIEIRDVNRNITEGKTRHNALKSLPRSSIPFEKRINILGQHNYGHESREVISSRPSSGPCHCESNFFTLRYITGRRRRRSRRRASRSLEAKNMQPFNL